jgi:hypothetical protein
MKRKSLLFWITLLLITIFFAELWYIFTSQRAIFLSPSSFFIIGFKSAQLNLQLYILLFFLILNLGLIAFFQLINLILRIKLYSLLTLFLVDLFCILSIYLLPNVVQINFSNRLLILLFFSFVVSIIIALLISFLLSRYFRFKQPIHSILFYFIITITSLVTITCIFIATDYGAKGKMDVDQVVLIAVDGATGKIINRLTREGKVPNFKHMIREGAYGRLETLKVLNSAQIWTTIATGKHPEKHGVKGFLDGNDALYSSKAIKAFPFWSILSNVGFSFGSSGWMFSFPAPSTKCGFIISDQAHLLPVFWKSRFDNKGIASSMQRFTSYPYNSSFMKFPQESDEYRLNNLIYENYKWSFVRDTFYHHVGSDLFQKYRPKFYAIYFRGIDHFSHFFWYFYKPEVFTEKYYPDSAVPFFKHSIDNYYVYIDSLIGEILKMSDKKRTTFIIVSDHGLTNSVGKIKASFGMLATGSHNRDGIIIMYGNGVQNGITIEDAEVADILPTALAVLGLPIGRDMDGKILYNVFTDEFFNEKPARYIKTWDTPKIGTKEMKSIFEEEIKNHLRTLGYIK